MVKSERIKRECSCAEKRARTPLWRRLAHDLANHVPIG